MTQRLDVARGRDVLARWCNLAEKRLEYLTELFETGRWRRFHSETAFFENIMEAKSAVETWRDLSKRKTSPDNKTPPDNLAVDVSRSGRAGMMSLRNRAQNERPSSQPIRFPAEVTARVHSAAAIDTPAFEPDLPALERTPEPAGDNAAEPAHDVASIQERYPLLRNAL
ncbi:MAG: TIGR03809 family protein [Bradyrhizobium sp.]|uniref:TIGR03809 family protein n=1 Tax=Bradyrhizobium sp. TaxID=376 RepID=UPI0023A0C15B|nr:TIGR03809 family protein [Bradyrhizobium sp.]MDE2603379.1 TIGR03809 family protein [Bradyrhizobium sp.]